MSSPLVVSWVHVAKCLVFCVDQCFYFFLLTFLFLTIVLSILLRFTASKYTFCNFKAFLIGIAGRRDRMVVGFTTTYMQSVPFTSKVVSSNLFMARSTRYSIMGYNLSATCDRSVVFLRVHRFPPPIKPNSTM